MNEKMLALMASSNEEIKQAKIAIRVAKKAIWEAKCKIEKADARKASLLYQASQLKPKPPKDGFNYNFPVQLSISSPKDSDRKFIIGNFASVAHSIHAVRIWQAEGKQKDGAKFYVRDLRAKKDPYEPDSMVPPFCIIKHKTELCLRFPKLARKLATETLQRYPLAA